MMASIRGDAGVECHLEHLETFGEPGRCGGEGGVSLVEFDHFVLSMWLGKRSSGGHQSREPMRKPSVSW